MRWACGRYEFCRWMVLGSCHSSGGHFWRSQKQPSNLMVEFRLVGLTISVVMGYDIVFRLRGEFSISNLIWNH